LIGVGAAEEFVSSLADEPGDMGRARERKRHKESQHRSGNQHVMHRGETALPSKIVALNGEVNGRAVDVRHRALDHDLIDDLVVQQTTRHVRLTGPWHALKA
jgi:hypothetical protein